MSRYDAIEDDRLCDICEPLNGVIRPADEWTGKVPPLHYQCRCILTPLTDDDAQKEGVADKLPDVEPLEGFGNPERGQAWQPDVDSYPPEIRDLLDRRISDDG
jgi:hypothetical protein